MALEANKNGVQDKAFKEEGAGVTEQARWTREGLRIQERRSAEGPKPSAS